LNIFNKRKYSVVPIHNLQSQPSIPDGMWEKCLKCGKVMHKTDITDYKVCPHCGSCFRLRAGERVRLTADGDSFEEFGRDVCSSNPLDFPRYDDKLNKLYKDTGMHAAAVTGRCYIGGIRAVLCVMDTAFIMGSLGSAEGEKLTLAFERAADQGLPVVLFAASGGARMQEGVVSLMQMAKVSGAVARHSKKGLLYICVLTDPTTGGVTASFAMQADIILSEPKALIGFAGQRVIEQTIRQKLPEGFQSAEFLLEHGFVDKIVRRQDMKRTLAGLLAIHGRGDRHDL